MLVDSHCHLEYEGLVDEQEAVLDRARGVGVQARNGSREQLKQMLMKGQ